MATYTLTKNVYIPTDNGGDVHNSGEVLDLDNKLGEDLVERGAAVAGELQKRPEQKPVISGNVIDEFTVGDDTYQARKLEGRNGQTLYVINEEAFIDEHAFEKAKQESVKDALVVNNATAEPAPVLEPVASEGADNAPLVPAPEPTPAPAPQTATVPTPAGTTQDEVAAVLAATEASSTPQPTEQNN